MAADLNLLNPALKKMIPRLIDQCKAMGIEMRPSNGLRTPVEQAKLWRQSRSTEEITAKIADFDDKGAHFLAECLRKAGPQHGSHVTNAPPGLSWHQWGEALDCFWLLNGQAEWSTTKLVNGLNGYKVYADQAEKLGLFAGGHWKKFKDWPHVQLQNSSSPIPQFSITEIDKAMKSRFG